MSQRGQQIGACPRCRSSFCGYGSSSGRHFARRPRRPRRSREERAPHGKAAAHTRRRARRIADFVRPSSARPSARTSSMPHSQYKSGLDGRFVYRTQWVAATGELGMILGRFGPKHPRSLKLCQTGSGIALKCVIRIERRSRRNRSLAWLWGQPDEFLGWHASVQQRSTHRHRLEGAIIAPFVTIGAGASQHFLDKRTPQDAGCCLASQTCGGN